MGMSINTFSDSYVARRTVADPVTGCFLWQGGKIKGGYGKTSQGGKTLVAHRAIWEARNGPVPVGLILCHKCDNPGCVNPDHFFLGTHKENSQDMKNKGRQARGSRVSLAKINDEIVIKIRNDKDSYKAIAKKFGLCPTSIRNIKLGLTWGHVTL